MLLTLMALGLQTLLNWAFVEKFELGGIALGMIISQSVLFALSLFYTAKLGIFQNLNPFTREAIRQALDKQQMISYLKIGVPGAFFLILEWGSFQGLTLLSGYLGDEIQLAAQVTLFNICIFCFYISYGLSLGVGTLVGNELGRGNPSAAKKIAKISMLISLCINLTTGLLLWLGKRPIAHIFTQDENVLEVLDGAMPFLAMHMVFDMTQGVQGGIIRGIGLQVKAMISALICYYAIGLPLAGYLMLKTNLKVKGAWIGIGTASFCINVCFGLILRFSEWKKVTN